MCRLLGGTGSFQIGFGLVELLGGNHTVVIEVLDPRVGDLGKCQTGLSLLPHTLDSLYLLRTRPLAGHGVLCRSGLQHSLGLLQLGVDLGGGEREYELAFTHLVSHTQFQ